MFVNLGHDIAFNLNKANITGEKNKTNAFLCMAFWIFGTWNKKENKFLADLYKIECNIVC